MSDVGFKNLFEIEDVSNLTRLGYTSSRTESLPAIICNGVLRWVCEAAKHEIAADQCTGSTFTCITMNNYYILWIIFKIVIDLKTKWGQQWNSWTMMISPSCSDDLLIKWRCIIFNSTHIINKVFAPMLLLKKVSHFINIVPIPVLPTVRSSRKTHCNDPWSNVSQIQVEAIFVAASSFSGDASSDSVFNKVKHFCLC